MLLNFLFSCDGCSGGGSGHRKGGIDGHCSGRANGHRSGGTGKHRSGGAGRQRSGGTGRQRNGGTGRHCSGAAGADCSGHFSGGVGGGAGGGGGVSHVKLRNTAVPSSTSIAGILDIDINRPRMACGLGKMAVHLSLMQETVEAEAAAEVPPSSKTFNDEP